MPDTPLSPIYQLADEIVERVAELNPISATSMGVPGHEDRLPDFSPDGAAKSETMRRDILARLATLPVTGERDRVARDVIHDVLETQRQRYEAAEHLRDLSIIRSPAMSIRRAFDLMPKATEEDWTHISHRLAAVPASLATFRQSLEEGLHRGTTAARRQVTANIEQAEAWSGATPGAGSYFAGIAEAVPGGITSTLRADLARNAESATAAYREFGVFLKERYFDGARERDSVGRDRYALESRLQNGIDLDLDETYAWGWEEFNRVEREMTKTCAKILPGASIAETIAFLESHEGPAIDGVDAFQGWMQELQDRTIAELDGVHFDIPGPLKVVEAMIAPPGGALAMYYTGPSEDFSRPGRTWYPTGGRTRFPLWGEVSIAYHEGVPGHHFQVGTTRYLAGLLSRFQRLLAGTSGYVEGWALYAERLMGELGYLEEPAYYLGMLRAQALRCVRVIVDIGMHLELPIPAASDFHPGETWDAALGDAFARERARFPADFMASEVTRYLGTPGQAISYKVGERCWLQARESARQRDGAAFDLKAWHKKALELGPMGLAQMQRELG